MSRWLTLLAIGSALMLAPALSSAQDPKAPAQSAAAQPKASKSEKACAHKFPSGEKRSWVCKKEEPCCAWDAISYVKCGSTITGCL